MITLTTLLKEYKQAKKNLVEEIKTLADSYSLNGFDLIQVRRNFLKIEQKEKEVKYCLEKIQEILKMDND